MDIVDFRPSVLPSTPRPLFFPPLKSPKGGWHLSPHCPPSLPPSLSPCCSQLTDRRQQSFQRGRNYDPQTDTFWSFRRLCPFRSTVDGGERRRRQMDLQILSMSTPSFLPLFQSGSTYLATTAAAAAAGRQAGRRAGCSGRWSSSVSLSALLSRTNTDRFRGGDSNRDRRSYPLTHSPSPPEEEDRSGGGGGDMMATSEELSFFLLSKQSHRISQRVTYSS